VHFFVHPKVFEELTFKEVKGDEGASERELFVRSVPDWSFDAFWYYPDTGVRIGNRVALATLLGGLVAQWIGQWIG